MIDVSAKGDPLGFRVIRPLELGDWKALQIDGAIPFQLSPECLAHAGSFLQTIATLTDEAGVSRVRVGCCPYCGYTGYIDRPVNAWIKQFYLSGMWDSGEGAKKARRISGVKGRKKVRRPNDSVQLINRLPIDPGRPVCEVGCGYGESLAYLKERGFQKLVGIEASPHRAEAVSEMLQIPVHTTAFEDMDLAAFRGQAPFALIFTHHVLEHIFDPHAVVSRCAALQGEGDYFVLSVPDVSAEPSMAVLAYFPHLHSFTFEAIARLLEMHGYEVVARSAEDRVITVAARRVAKQAQSREAGRPFVKEMETKLIRGLGLGKTYRTLQRRLWWAKKADMGGQAPYLPGSAFADLRYRIAMRLRRIRAPEAFSRGAQSLLVENLSHRGGDPKESPIEIQFAGPLTLFYK